MVCIRVCVRFGWVRCCVLIVMVCVSWFIGCCVWNVMKRVLRIVLNVLVSCFVR